MNFSGLRNLRNFDVLVYIITSYFLFRLYFLIMSEAFSDRSQFFNGGLYAPNIIDVLINEVFFSLVLTLIILGQFRWRYVIFTLIGAIVYFTRAGIVLLFLACMVSHGISRRDKIWLIILGGVASLLILVIRFEGKMPSLDEFLLLYIEYPFVGIGRLMVTDIDHNTNHFGALSLFFRPFGVVPFSIDYLLGLDGAFSIERHAGKLLSNFVFLPLLGDDFNAFGSIVFPYVIAYGVFYGFFVFFLSMAIFYSALRFIFDNKTALRFLLFLAISGLLFSWNSPFIWIAPFVMRFIVGEAVIGCCVGDNPKCGGKSC